MLMYHYKTQGEGCEVASRRGVSEQCKFRREHTCSQVLQQVGSGGWAQPKAELSAVTTRRRKKGQLGVQGFRDSRAFEGSHTGD